MHKFYAMNKGIRIFSQVCAYILFGAVFILIFGGFTRLRTTAAPHLYKEYLSGVFVLFMLFLNNLIIFPVFFKTNRIWFYLLLTAISVLATCTFEMVLVSSDVLPLLRCQFSPAETRLYFITDGLSVLFRDILLIGFSFSLSALQYYFDKNYQKDIAMAQDMHVLEAIIDDKSKTEIRVDIANMSYAIQEKNVTYLWLKTGERAKRYGSMRSLMKILNKECYVQLTGSTIAICKNILRYDTTGVIVKGKPKNFMLPYSELFREKAMSELYEKTGLNPHEIKSTRKKEVQQGSEHTHQQKNKTEKLICAFIAEHPGCSASEIKKNRSISQSTVNRILKQLKEDGLITYEGSKKTGGYRVVSS